MAEPHGTARAGAQEGPLVLIEFCQHQRLLHLTHAVQLFVADTSVEGEALGMASRVSASEALMFKSKGVIMSPAASDAGIEMAWWHPGAGG